MKDVTAIYYPSTLCPSFDVLCIPKTMLFSHARARALSALYIFDLDLSASFYSSTLRTVNSLSATNLYLWIKKSKSFVNCCFSTWLWILSEILEKVLNGLTCKQRPLNNSLEHVILRILRITIDICESF